MFSVSYSNIQKLYSYILAKSELIADTEQIILYMHIIKYINRSLDSVNLYIYCFKLVAFTEYIRITNINKKIKIKIYIYTHTYKS